MKLRDPSPIPLIRPVTLFIALLLLTSSWTTPVVAKKSDPTITKTKLDQAPRGIFYFDDSEVIILYNHRAGNILRSKNSGESWDTIEGIPDGKIVTVYLHPFEPKTAFALTAAYKHYVTHDRGESWKPFETAASPTPWREILTFHGTDPKSIIFQAEVCKSFFECDEVVRYSMDPLR